ncbi:TMV resistance protein N [Senna tora]|uniref:TMV resistance protein N n=1 Tax=Senna tora TaxID=362788 RepID=A0A834TNP4_9FABA|nr:TMV resistance protein N [Senna tora]
MCGMWIEFSANSRCGKNLDSLYVANCKQLETFQSSTSSSLISASSVETWAITDCCSQVHIISASQNSSLRCLLIQMGRKDQVTSTLTNSILQTLKTSSLDDCCLPGDNHPDWLSFSGEGPSAIFEVPQVSGYNLKRMTLCVVYLSSGGNITCEHLNNVLVINHTKTTIQLYKRDSIEDEDRELFRILNLETVLEISHTPHDFSLDIGIGENHTRYSEFFQHLELAENLTHMSCKDFEALEVHQEYVTAQKD